jgi:hypothetical protein
MAKICQQFWKQCDFIVINLTKFSNFFGKDFGKFWISQNYLNFLNCSLFKVVFFYSHEKIDVWIEPQKKEN